ncbi:MAG TPA: DoxX family membrane protein [Alloacidobacterium sp.]|nr:DoxX family membrane protein [Alloacidobacterium sp.]
MIPLLALIVVFLLARFLGVLGVSYLAIWQHCLRIAVAAMFLLTASAHWGRRRPDLVRMVPPIFPKPEPLITLTGIAEITGAVGILWEPTARLASAGLAVLLLVLFPANVYAARHHLMIDGRPVPGLAVRTVLQVVFIAAVVVAGWC